MSAATYDLRLTKGELQSLILAVGLSPCKGESNHALSRAEKKIVDLWIRERINGWGKL